VLARRFGLLAVTVVGRKHAVFDDRPKGNLVFYSSFGVLLNWLELGLELIASLSK